MGEQLTALQSRIANLIGLGWAATLASEVTDAEFETSWEQLTEACERIGVTERQQIDRIALQGITQLKEIRTEQDYEERRKEWL